MIGNDLADFTVNQCCRIGVGVKQIGAERVVTSIAKIRVVFFVFFIHFVVACLNFCGLVMTADLIRPFKNNRQN